MISHPYGAARGRDDRRGADDLSRANALARRHRGDADDGDGRVRRGRAYGYDVPHHDGRIQARRHRLVLARVNLRG